MEATGRHLIRRVEHATVIVPHGAQTVVRSVVVGGVLTVLRTLNSPSEVPTALYGVYSSYRVAAALQDIVTELFCAIRLLFHAIRVVTHRFKSSTFHHNRSTECTKMKGNGVYKHS